MTLPRVSMTGNFRVPQPVNEPPRQYAPGSVEANAVLQRIDELSSEVRELPHIIAGQRRMTETTWTLPRHTITSGSSLGWRPPMSRLCTRRLTPH